MSDEDHLERYVEVHTEMLRWIARLLERGEVPVVRYEELIRDLPGVAARIGGWLSVDLDAAAVADDELMRLWHATTPSAEESIGRWRREMSPEMAAAFTRGMRAELAALGFES